jgi:hypothetical protein
MSLQTEAAVVVSNLSGTDNANASPQSTFWLGQAFTTDDTSYNLQSVGLQGGNSPSGSSVYLYSDSGSLPSAQLGSFSTTDFGSTSDTYTLPVNDTITLDPSETYWIVFAPNDVNFGLWQRTPDGNQDGPGAIPDLQASSNDGGSSFSSQAIDGFLKLEINADPVPEPSVPVTFLAGTILLGSRRKRH